ncbi:hypothetical protein CC79DRAFT_1326739 [Sarocladium strictum]
MTTSRRAKPVKRERQRITRTACEPCRKKRAKRTWASKCSLQDGVASLREQVHRRERLLDAICATDASGYDVVRMLRDSGVSYDEAYKKVQGSDAGLVTLDITMGSPPPAAPASVPDVNSFDNILDSTSPVQSLSSDILGDYPTVIDPMLWAPVNSSDPPGQLVLDSWFSLMTDPTDRPKSGTVNPYAT